MNRLYSVNRTDLDETKAEDTELLRGFHIPPVLYRVDLTF